MANGRLVTILDFGHFYRENCPTLLCIVIKVEQQPSILDSRFAGWVAEMEFLCVEASVKQLAAGQGHVGCTTVTGDECIYARDGRERDQAQETN